MTKRERRKKVKREIKWIAKGKSEQEETDIKGETRKKIKGGKKKKRKG